MLNTDNIKKIKYGNNIRYTFGKTEEADMPYVL